MKTSAALITFFAGILSWSAVHADTLRTTRGQPVTEVSHTVTLRVQGGIATFDVRRSFANAGDTHDEAVLWLDMPDGAVATGLRIRAGNTWYEGEFMEAEEAAAKYEELTGMGAHQAKDPALLVWESSSALRLHVFPVPPRGTATLEYTLSAPLEWKEGAAVIHYPRGGDGSRLAPAVLQFSEHAADIFVDGRLATFEQPVVLSRRASSRGGYAEIRLQTGQSEIVGRMGSTHSITLQHDKIEGFSKIEYDLPARLSEMPQNAKVVFLMDRSRSVGDHLMEAQFDILRGFASYLPDAQFEVVMVDRFASPMNGALVGQQAFLNAVNGLSTTCVARQNGSNLDAGLAVGREILKDVEGPRFIVALTDNRLRRSWNTFAAAKFTGITTHVVVLDRGFVRDDEHRLAPIALTDGGILVRAGASSSLKDSLEHLVRPTRLEQVTIDGLEEPVGTLEEGASYRIFQAFAEPPEATLRAKIWSRSIEITPHTRPDFDRATVGWVFSHDLHDELDDADRMALAAYARVVSPVTSYLAIEPGVRPSVAGLDREEGGFGAAGVGMGGGGIAGHASVIRGAPEFKLDPEACRKLHPDQSARVSVHTTTVEIVDVVTKDTTAFARCIVEDIWAIELSPEYRHFDYRIEKLSY